MPISADDVEWVEEPAMNFWESTFLPAIFGGLQITGSHVVDGQYVTKQYPEEKPTLPTEEKPQQPVPWPSEKGRR